MYLIWWNGLWTLLLFMDTDYEFNPTEDQRQDRDYFFTTTVKIFSFTVSTFWKFYIEFPLLLVDLAGGTF